MAKRIIRKIRCIETGEVFSTQSEASRKLGINQSMISAVLLNKRKSAGGYSFEYAEDLPEPEQMYLTITNEQGETIPVIDSREVARMMDTQHRYIIRYIEGDGTLVGIIPVLNQSSFSTCKYFIESSYLGANATVGKCYLCTRLGCDMLANRLNGEKGILFNAKYVERFKEMEEELKSKSEHQHPDLAKEDELILSVVKGATPLDRAKALQEYTALITDKATAPLKEELTQTKAELNEKTEFIDDINDCFTFYKVKEYNKQLLRDRKDIVLSTAKLNEVAAELGIPINKIDNPIEHSPYRRINAYPRKVWMTAYPDIKLPEKPDIKLPEKKESK